MWEARRKALEPPKKSKTSNQKRNTRQSSESPHTSLRTKHNTSPRARNFVLNTCPHTNILINPRTGLHAETSFSPTVFVQLEKTW